MLDPFYRTIQGFETLIEREFSYFGHPFKARLGNGAKSHIFDKEYVPIFALFIDCVYQIYLQFPTQFEFNTKFLKKILINSLTLRFGTFLCNNEFERKAHAVAEKTVSMWRYLDQKKEKYTNLLYFPDLNPHGYLIMYPTILKMRVWENVYMRWIPILGKQPEDSYLYF